MFGISTVTQLKRDAESAQRWVWRSSPRRGSRCPGSSPARAQCRRAERAQSETGVLGPIDAKDYDGTADDLLTGGLGWDGWKRRFRPLAADPSAAELRRRAIHTNYRAVLDITTAGGYGRLYAQRELGRRGGLDAGSRQDRRHRYLAYADDGSGRQNVTLMVQVPDAFDPDQSLHRDGDGLARARVRRHRCVGRMGVQARLRRRYTDKGTGNGLHDLMTGRVGLIDGTRADAAEPAAPRSSPPR